MKDEYVFHINKFTPETIPQARLAEYLAAISKVFGSERGVHFRELISASAGIASVVEEQYAADVWQRVQIAPTPDAPVDLAAAYKAVNDMLYADGTTGDLERGNIKVLRFAGCEIVRPPRMGPFTQNVEIDGVLVRVGGKDKTAHIMIEDGDRNTWNFEVTREQAKAMAPHLFGNPLRIVGTIRWVRDEHANWIQQHGSARAHDFAMLNEENLQDAVARLRSIYGESTGKPPDPLSLIRDLRNDGESIN